MQKTIILEIGHTTTIANVLGDLDTKSPKWLGQGKGQTRLTDPGLGIRESLQNVGDQLGLTPEELLAGSNIYPVSAFFSQNLKEALQEFTREIPKLNVKEFLPILQALSAMAEKITQEVGSVLILDVGGTSTDIFLAKPDQSGDKKSNIKNGPAVYREHYGDLGIDEEAESLIQKYAPFERVDRHGVKRQEIIKPFPETPGEITLGTELTTYALEEALTRFCQATDFPSLRWVVGTGGAITQLPGGLEIVKEALTHCKKIADSEETPVLLDRYNLMAGLGAIVRDYPGSAWLLLQESLGVES